MCIELTQKLFQLYIIGIYSDCILSILSHHKKVVYYHSDCSGGV